MSRIARVAAGLASLLFAGSGLAADPPAAAESVGMHRPTEAETGPPALRCGWWDNPTPGNVFFTDRDGEWTIAMQGLYEADGDWPRFARGETAPRNATHAHGCACAKMQGDARNHLVSRFTEAHARPLEACRGDPALKGKEPTPR
ncbi:MAG: DUF4087 domain-containing protein [Betaproteobacteria bacterium]